MQICEVMKCGLDKNVEDMDLPGFWAAANFGSISEYSTTLFSPSCFAKTPTLSVGYAFAMTFDPT